MAAPWIFRCRARIWPLPVIGRAGIASSSWPQSKPPPPEASSTSSSTNPSNESPPSGTADPPIAAADTAEQRITKECEELREKYKHLEDKYKRALADTENVRQRMKRQIDDAKQYGIQGFCKDLLDVADVLQKAMESVPPTEITENNPHLKNLYEGLKMTEGQLQKVFRLHGLTQVNPIGEKFDPNQHEALFEQAVEGKTPGSIAIVTKIGYRLHDRIIRPASVGVVKAAS